MNQPWTIQLFGGLRARHRDRTIARFRTQKTGALLAYLAYHLGHSHSRETLIEMFWPDSEPESGRHSLSLALSSLRHQLEPPGVPSGGVIVADRYSVEVNPDAVRTDVREFEQALRSAAQARNSPSHLPLLEQAAARYGGALLPGYYEDWIPTEQERLAQRYFQTVSQLIAELEAAGRLERALEIAQGAAAIDPIREDIARDLMRLLASAGQPDAAFRAYSELVSALDRELGDEPSEETRRLAREIQTSSIPVTFAAPAPKKRREQPAPSALPTGTVTFLLSDIEGSTALWERAGEAFRSALSTHHAVIRNEIRRNGGHEVKEAGDSFLMAFGTAGDALACAVACQRGLAAQPWPDEVGPLKIRMALHTGDVELQDGEYHGLLLHHASRMQEAAHGGQILCSESTASLVRRDLEPNLQLKDLGVYRLRDVAHPERLFQVCYAEMPQGDFPPLLAESVHTARLPIQFTRFFGRETELEQLQGILNPGSGVKLVTLTGPGGTGKTRLAIEAANRVADSFGGAVTFAALADLADATLLAGEVLDAMSVAQNPSTQPIDQLVDVLGREPHLLILDNLEQVAEEGAAFVQTLLERAPFLTCLATSRQVLGLTGEHEFPVSPLPIPDSPGTPELLGMFDSVRLFVDRAQAVKPDFRVTNSNAPAVAELCNRLEGIPLAIELAAARAQVLTPAQMLDQLAHRFDFLVTRRRGVAERQRTLRAAMDWSYKLLPPELQGFFARLGVFRGGWTVDAAESVGHEALALDHLAQLRESSLVQTEESPAGMRFRMLEMLREYACEQLDGEEEANVNRRHAEHYLALAETAADELRGERQSEWLERLELEHANLRAAVEWCGLQESDLKTGLRLAGALSRFWSIRGHAREARPMVERLLTSAAADHPELGSSTERAGALDAAGSLAHDMGDFVPAAAFLKSSLAIWRKLGDAPRQAYALNLAGNVALDGSDGSAAQTLYQEALSVYRSLGDRLGTAMVLSNMTVVALESGDLTRAAELAEENLALKRQLANPHGLAIALENLGNIRMRMGELEESRNLHAEALAIRRAIGHRLGIAMSLNNLGHTLLAMRDVDPAADHLSESIDLFHELGDSRGLAEALEGAAGVLFARGQHEAGANLLGAARTLPGPHDSAQETESQPLAAARESLGEKRFEKAIRTGSAWATEAAVLFAKESLTEAESVS